MREIKFRVWCCVDRWAHEVTFFSSGGWQARSGIEGYNENDGAILMQFTGIKDENGKDIYEGDIVRWYGEGKTYTRVVEWIGDEAMFLPNSMKDGVEIIGNIYENPELVQNKYLDTSQETM